MDLIDAIRIASGSTSAVLHTESRSGDIRFSEADIGAVRALLGYETAVSFETGVQKTYEWYVSSLSATC